MDHENHKRKTQQTFIYKQILKTYGQNFTKNNFNRTIPARQLPQPWKQGLECSKVYNIQNIMKIRV